MKNYKFKIIKAPVEEAEELLNDWARQIGDMEVVSVIQTLSYDEVTNLVTTVMYKIDPAKLPIESPGVGEVNCPKCGGPTALRRRKADGAQFWGCKAYPTCTGLYSYEDGLARMMKPVAVASEKELPF